MHGIAVTHPASDQLQNHVGALADADGAALLVLDDLYPKDLTCVSKVRHVELVHECLADFCHIFSMGLVMSKSST